QLLRDQPPTIEARVYWDAETEAVVAEQQSRIGALIVERRPQVSAADGAVAAAMCDGVRALGLQVLPWTEAAHQLQARVASLRAWRPDEDWPDLGDDGLSARLEEWLLPQLDGI